MPKYAVHHIVLKLAAQELAASQAAPARNAANVIGAEMPTANIGAIGPDLFFWGPDYELVAKLYKLYQNIADVVALYNKIVQPIRDAAHAIGDPIEDAVSTLAPNTVNMIKLLLEELGETAALFKSSVSTGLLAGVLDGFAAVDLLTNPFDVAPASQQLFQTFAPPLQDGKPEKEWYWFDMLHYRRVGKFARYLTEKAGSPRAKAYAFGYLSHIASDVTGHPFVNQVSGTTYRIHVQRHATIENFMDCWKYYYTYGQSLPTGYLGESINKTLLTRLNLPSTLPTEVGDLLFSAYRDVYGNVPHPKRLPGDGFYTRGQIDETYDLFYKVLKMMEGMGVERPTEPFSGVGDILAEALQGFTPPPAPPTSASSTCSWEDVLSFGLTQNSRECYEEFFEEAAKWLDYLGDLLAWTFDTILALIDLLLTIFLSLPITVLLALLYGIQLLCYDVYRTARRILSQSGFVAPEPDELDSSVARNLVTPYQCAVLNFKGFPSVGVPTKNNLTCPIPRAESPGTAAGFHPPTAATTPDAFIQQVPFSEDAVRKYAAAATPGQTREIEQQRHTIGNARDFTAWMVRHANNPASPPELLGVVFTDWNLDSDRGYGYLGWDGAVPDAEPYEVTGEKYVR